MNGNHVGARTLAYFRGEMDLFLERERLSQMRKALEESGLTYWLLNAENRRGQTFWRMVSLLQDNSRMRLTEMSRRLQVPVSTLHDLLKEVEKFFCFTIVLKDNEKQVLGNVSAGLELCYEFADNVPKAKEVPLSAYMK